MLVCLGEIRDPEFLVTSFPPPTVDDINGLCVDKQAAE
jgi:hypothetical protein